MNFFHIPSFEDHSTFKIWLKNWNLPVDNNLFKAIHRLNRLFNLHVPSSAIQCVIDQGKLDELLPYKQAYEDGLRFQIYVKEDFSSKEQIKAHFHRNMHFLVYVVNVDGEDESELRETVNSLRKFAFIRDFNVYITLAVCRTTTASRVMARGPNVIVIDSFEQIDVETFKKVILPLFLCTLKEKVAAMPRIERFKVECSTNDFLALQRTSPSDFDDARAFKLRGDMAVILGSPDDSLNYYSKALEVLMLEGKHKRPQEVSGEVGAWLGSVLESIGACHYSTIKKQGMPVACSDSATLALVEELSAKTTKALELYKAEGQDIMVFELRLKLLGLFSLLKEKGRFVSHFNCLRNELATVRFDPRIYLYIGDLASNAGLKRIAVYALLECSRQLRAVNELESIRQECLQMCARIFKLDVESYKNKFSMLETLPKHITYIILANLVEINFNSRNNEATLHYLLLLMKKFEVEKTFKQITEQTMWAQPFYRYEYDILPYVQRIVPECQEKTYRELVTADEKGATKQESVFIYDPRNKSRFLQLNWVAQREASVTVYLTNPLPIGIKIDSIGLESDGVGLASYSSEVHVAPLARNVECRIKVRPVEPGLMSIKGVKVRIGGLAYLNTVDRRGVGSIYKYAKRDNPYIYEKHYLSNDVNLDFVRIAENVPAIGIEPRNYVPETIFYNENVLIQYRVHNRSKSRAVRFKVSVKIDYENALMVTLAKELPSLQLDHNKSFDFDFTLYQGQGSQNNNKSPEVFELQGNDKAHLYFENRNMIERVYKVTTAIECRFSDNRDYVCSKEVVNTFKVALLEHEDYGHVDKPGGHPRAREHQRGLRVADGRRLRRGAVLLRHPVAGQQYRQSERLRYPAEQAQRPGGGLDQHRR